MRYAKVEVKESYDKETFVKETRNFTTKKNAKAWLTERKFHKVYTMAGVDHYREDEYHLFAELSWDYIKLEDAILNVERTY